MVLYCVLHFTMTALYKTHENSINYQRQSYSKKWLLETFTSNRRWLQISERVFIFLNNHSLTLTKLKPFKSSSSVVAVINALVKIFRWPRLSKLSLSSANLSAWLMFSMCCWIPCKKEEWVSMTFSKFWIHALSQDIMPHMTLQNQFLTDSFFYTLHGQIMTQWKWKSLSEIHNYFSFSISFVLVITYNLKTFIMWALVLFKSTCLLFIVWLFFLFSMNKDLSQILKKNDYNIKLFISYIFHLM